MLFFLCTINTSGRKQTLTPGEAGGKEIPLMCGVKRHRECQQRAGTDPSLRYDADYYLAKPGDFPASGSLCVPSQRFKSLTILGLLYLWIITNIKSNKQAAADVAIKIPGTP